MNSIKRSRELNVSADQAWTLIGRPESISEWHPAIEASPMKGLSRECRLADGALIQEEIREHDDAGRRYTYVVVGGPLPVKDYSSTLRVDSVGEGRCRVEWACSFEPLAPPEQVEAMIQGVYDAGLNAIAERLR